jgi:hypothetical protein
MAFVARGAGRGLGQPEQPGEEEKAARINEMWAISFAEVAQKRPSALLPTGGRDS